MMRLKNPSCTTLPTKLVELLGENLIDSVIKNNAGGSPALCISPKFVT